MSVALTLLAMLIEAVVGYPDRLVRAIGHPVIWIGTLITALERLLNRDGEEARTGSFGHKKGAVPKSAASPLEGEVGWRSHPGGRCEIAGDSLLPDPQGGRERSTFTPLSAPSPTLPRSPGREPSAATREGEAGAARGEGEASEATRKGKNSQVKSGNDKAFGARVASRIPGVIVLLILLAVVGGTSLAVERALLALPVGLIALALIASSLIAQRSLHDHVARVAVALEAGGLDAGRAAVSQIVGRDPAALDEAGVARAAIESLAENFSDGVVAPVVWLALGGLPGAALYKAVNTADSMIGHRTPRYEHFGWAAARLDDVLNLPASRLSALALIAAAAMTSRGAAAQAWRAVRRDAPHHRSPNAGYPEAAMAGALGLKLAGPRVYSSVRVDDAFMGDGRRETTAADIRAALALYRRADALLMALLAVVSFAVWLHW